MIAQQEPREVYKPNWAEFIKYSINATGRTDCYCLNKDCL